MAPGPGGWDEEEVGDCALRDGHGRAGQTARGLRREGLDAAGGPREGDNAEAPLKAAAQGVRGEDGRGAKNTTLLLLNVVLFGSFASLQLTFAVLAHSLALLGDSAIMVIDAFTYGLNLYAERRKRAFGSRRMPVAERVWLEVLIPLASVSSLVVVVVGIVGSAVQTLLLRVPPDNVNETTAQGFAIANLCLDLICIGAFYVLYAVPQSRRACPLLDLIAPDADGGPAQNANMCSAFTHIAADTIRSITVLIASIVAKSNPQWSSNVVDSVAALFVSTVILVLVTPLLARLRARYNELHAEELLFQARAVGMDGKRGVDQAWREPSGEASELDEEDAFLL